MYLDFEDHRPDTPSVPPAISLREGVLLSLVLHLTLTIAYLLTPKGFFDREIVVAEAPPPAPQESVQFVMMEPLVERPAPPPPRAEMSDLDRRATTIERPPQAEDPTPFSRGNTPDKVVGAPPTPPSGGDRGNGPPTPTPDPATTPPDAAGVVPEEVTARAAGEGLARSLQNLQNYLKQDNLSNQRGGDAEQDAQISFDSKGVDFGWWLRRFVTQVKSNWMVPQMAMLTPGRVVITFNVHRNGFMSDITLLKSSGFQALDSAALNALRTSNPTVPLPPEYPDDKAFFTVTFLYTLR